jgi:uncharacterized membrane protein YdbT with pleckstrin-like domain
MNGIFGFLSKTTYNFEGKKEGEEVVIFLHRHWFTISTKLAYIACSACIPFIIVGLFGRIIASLGLLPLFAVLWSAFYMVLWYAIFYSLTMYTLDTWIVTNMRIINSVQHGFFNRSISELSLDKIQDVAFDVDGALATMLNFGNIKVQTAGSERHFMFEDTPAPQQVKDTIMNLVSTKKHNHEIEIGQELKNELFGGL